ncbi:acetyltransferase [Cloacibacillus evryensis]|uniref:Acetyltransferase n=1 Tax=Cloacibacillus evryensis TaxID=508460 RepID=A0AAW5JXQ4_9BACT|nr:acetyltransferase [Cloacibacillus evryensis]EHL70748.1 sialic acid O-acetyltransferase NeuD family sugar O-acyltransferase [Synergistes sp. 3_1_syn1]MCQ4813161.1 acetyltransferase [Cloacibacillus evryensis]MEA5033771.1 acetyltransferase [Cloacibacillus evryensis]
MEKKSRVFLIGAGNHAKVVLSALVACGFECMGIYDDDQELWGQTLWCLPIYGPVSKMPDTAETMAVLAIGDNGVRRAICEKFKNVCWPVVIHPKSEVDSSVRIGEGTIVMAGCIIEPDAVIGRHSIVNSGCYIGHDTKVGDYCHAAPRSAAGDNVTIADGVFLGIGSLVRPYTAIAENSAVGIGSAVIKDIGPGGTWVGSPARRIPSPVRMYNDGRADIAGTKPAGDAAGGQSPAD